ncbi:HAD family hydrolase [Clostridium sp. SHJSY1]|uniref:HAD family hydrolase n=1 Tax=Clostridium sp. SHJSY1 TaxID=2942483 RepID=UPI00287552AA|nr:HAD family hydrolase [Clostridium sp. SHJSY1]MDS0528135.1 HAD family hydrolase [Clostridium sp. SHJSY1]
MNLYISDLDGTLLNSNALISNNSKILLNKAIKNGINFTIATARTPATVIDILKDINITLPIITMNGSAIYNIKDNRYFYYLTIEQALVHKLQNIIAKENLSAFIYSIMDNHLFVYHKKLTHPHQIKFYEERKNTIYKTFLEKSLPIDLKVLYFTIMDYEDKINSLYYKIKDIPGLSIVKYRDTYNKEIVNLEIYHESASKANAINYLKNYFHFDKLITFGDNLNDIPMFKISDECYAVINAVDELKEISTSVIKSNLDDSVAKFLNNINKNLNI